MAVDYAVFIISHNRADRVITYKTLRMDGYTGSIYIVIDNEDEQADKYYQKYGRDSVIMFDKQEVSKMVDRMDINDNLGSPVYVRNEIYNIAAKLGLEYFIMLDDDYTGFYYRMDNNYNYVNKDIGNLDMLFESSMRYYASIDALAIAWAQSGDFIGGAENGILGNVYRRRKAMNVWFCSTARRIKWVGTLNDDVNTVLVESQRGGLFLTIPFVIVMQQRTQQHEGGITERYLSDGTYVKSFYSVMCAPSCCTVSVMGVTNKRMHHAIRWANAVPMIVSEAYRKLINES